MLIDIKPTQTGCSLHDMLGMAELCAATTRFGDDIDAAHRDILHPGTSSEARCAALLAWASRHQPCLFGRLGARNLKGIGIDVCWIDEEEIAKGDHYLTEKIQIARRAWKRHAADGEAHGFLIVFNGPRLAFLPPGRDLLAICEKIANLYLVEHAPIDRDTVYTESMPLRHESLKLFKAGVNIFYPSAHRTRNHDRRIPGGLMISVNSPGHWATRSSSGSLPGAPVRSCRRSEPGRRS